MYSFLTILKMDIKNLFKNPVLLGYNSVFIFFIILIMGFLTSGGYQESKDAYQYYTLSFIVYSMLNGAMTASNCFMERDIKRPNLRIIHSPAGGFQIYFSKIVASFLFNTVLHVSLLLIMTQVLSLTLGNKPAYFLLLMLPIEFGAACLGIFFCCLFHSEEATSSLLSNLISLLALLGGTFFSLERFGAVITTISRLSPIKWINDAFFEMAIDSNLHLYWYIFFGGVLVSFLLVLGCKLTFKSEDYL